MIGVMIPSVYADEYASAPDHIRDSLLKKDCLKESEYNTWKDGECIAPDWLPTKKQNLNFMPKGETPEHIEELLTK